jgi:hypothetical protein
MRGWGPWTGRYLLKPGRPNTVVDPNKNSKCPKQNFVVECFCSYDKICRTTNFVVRHLNFVVAYDIFVKRFITIINRKCRRKNSICRRHNCRNFVVTTFIIICRRHKKNVVGFWMEFGRLACLAYLVSGGIYLSTDPNRAWCSSRCFSF